MRPSPYSRNADSTVAMQSSMVSNAATSRRVRTRVPRAGSWSRWTSAVMARLGQRLVETLNQLHASPQQLRVSHALMSPADQHAIEADAFDAAEFRVAKVGVMDDPGDRRDARIAKRERPAQRLERAVVAAVAKSVWKKRVERHGAG